MTLGWELLTVITSLSLPLDTAVLRFIDIIVEVSVDYWGEKILCF